MSSRVLFAVALLFSIAYGSPVTENRIYGGQEAKPGQFPHQASLHAHGYHICGGSILASRFILTAAHCVWQRYAPIYSIVVGAHQRIIEDGRVHQISRFIWHDDYNQTTLQHDVALVEAKTPIDFDERVAPISLHREFIGAGIEAVTSGWGKTNDNVTNLKFARVKTLADDECRRLVEKQSEAFPFKYFGTVCAYAGKSNAGVCSGDSGGPLVYNNKLIGVTSWWVPCGQGYPDGYTRVSEYVDWIEKNMKTPT